MKIHKFIKRRINAFGIEFGSYHIKMNIRKATLKNLSSSLIKRKICLIGNQCLVLFFTSVGFFEQEMDKKLLIKNK